MFPRFLQDSIVLVLKLKKNLCSYLIRNTELVASKEVTANKYFPSSERVIGEENETFTFA